MNIEGLDLSLYHCTKIAHLLLDSAAEIIEHALAKMLE
jgi:hypothetical protein